MATRVIKRKEVSTARKSIATRRAYDAKRISVIDLSESFDSNQTPVVNNLSSNKNKAISSNEEIDLENREGVIRNSTFVQCGICLFQIDTFLAVCIRNCLHYICIDCTRSSIICSNTVEIKCPVNTCAFSLQDREVRALLTPPEYEIHLQKIDHQNSDSLYDQMVNLQKKSRIIHNLDPFECEICFENIATSEGVMVSDCLHQFCTDCVRNTIINNEDAVVKCPANTCECFIHDREIRWLMTQEEYDKHSMKMLRITESTASNSYHCKKPNCDSWCFVEDEVNTFVCPRCQSLNCLACQAIHDGLNCKQYQEELRYAGMSDDQRTNVALDNIVEKNLGMRCTKCKIVIMKRDGCDWLRCTMCKTELCWATKGSRWGPNGKGDTSGGCRCQITKKCHPKCRNCH